MTTGYQPSVRALNLDLTPVEVAARLRHLGGIVFFDSAVESLSGSEPLSIVAAAPTEFFTGQLEQDSPVLKQVLNQRRVEVSDNGIPTGFLAGAVSYEGEFRFGLYQDALIYRHRNASWVEVGSLAGRMVDHSPAPLATRAQFAPECAREDFLCMVHRAQEYIAAGDIYQVNLAHRFSGSLQGDPFGFYESLRHYSPAPYAAYLELGDATLLSASPECFLDLSGASVRTRPIKGTRPRRAMPDEDERSAFDLITSPKEVAELIMITDLERNDLGKICDYGTVNVRDLLALERFQQVFHLVSTVEGTLRAECDHVDVLSACFPGGSITGAPKKRAREIITELEAGPRGFYTGAIGWLGFNGESRFNIAIRTVVAEGEQVHFHVGAGIVADSKAEAEWQETLDKAAGILLAASRME